MFVQEEYDPYNDLNADLTVLGVMLGCDLDPAGYVRASRADGAMVWLAPLLDCAGILRQDMLSAENEDILAERISKWDVEVAGAQLVHMSEHETRRAAAALKLRELRPVLIEVGVFIERPKA